MPSQDGKWLSVLLRAAGLPRHALRLRDTDEALADSVLDLFRPALPQDRLGQAVADILAQVKQDADGRPVRHRALADAEEERRKWLEALRLACKAREQAERS